MSFTGYVDVAKTSRNVQRLVKKRYGIVVIPGRVIEGEEIFVPTFEVSSNHSIRLSDLKSRRFYIIDRTPIEYRWVKNVSKSVNRLRKKRWQSFKEEARGMLAKSMIEPIKQALEQQGFARRLLMPDPLPEEEEKILIRYKQELPQTLIEGEEIKCHVV